MIKGSVDILFFCRNLPFTEQKRKVFVSHLLLAGFLLSGQVLNIKKNKKKKVIWLLSPLMAYSTINIGCLWFFSNDCISCQRIKADKVSLLSL